MTMGLASGDFMGLHTSLSSSGAPTQSSWTDDLPPCESTGVGFSVNQKYHPNGYRNSEHELEDAYFHFNIDDTTRLYGVFDGHRGVRSANFAKHCLPGHIVLGELKDKKSDEEVYELLRSAFVTVDQEYFVSTIGDSIARREAVLSQPEEMFDDDYARNQLAELNSIVGSGTSAVVVLIFRGKLYASNVGDSRALLCCTDAGGVMSVMQLTVDHDIHNEEEVKRLQSLYVDVSLIRQMEESGNRLNTRCLGNYLVKGGYKELPALTSASSEPVIPDPQVHKAITLDDTHRFLLLFSHGLYEALSDVSEGDSVNTKLAQLVVEEFKIQPSLNAVAQAVIDKVCRIHQDHCSSTNNVNKRDDMTLLIRNFNFPLPNSHSPVNGKIVRNRTSQSSVPSDTPTSLQPPDIVISTVNNNPTSAGTEDSTITENSVPFSQPVQKLPLDSEGRIMPYVDFSGYFMALAAENEEQK